MECQICGNILCIERDCLKKHPIDGPVVVNYYSKTENHKPTMSNFDSENALIDLIGLIEDKSPEIFALIDPTTLIWWEQHTKSSFEKLRAAALAKLSEREKRVLGLK